MFESSFGDGYLEGKSEGRVEGIHEATMHIALKLYQAGAKKELIAQTTGYRTRKLTKSCAMQMTELDCASQDRYY